MSSFKKYVAFEGIDASGKSTQAKLFCRFLKDNGYRVFCTKEPGGMSSTKKIREILLKERLNPKARLFLFLSDRAMHMEVVEKHLKNDIVISDRSMFSTIAYQAFGENMDLRFVESSNMFATSGVLPDITFVIDIGVDVMHKRLTDRDMIESKGDEFFNRVKKGYRYIADNFENVYIIDGEKPVNEVFEDILKIWNRV